MLQKMIEHKNVKHAGGAGSADQESMEEFSKYQLSVTEVKVMWKSRFLMLMRPVCFMRMLTMNIYGANHVSVDENVTRGLQEPNPVNPLGTNSSIFTNSGFSVTLLNITITNNNNQLYIFLATFMIFLFIRFSSFLF